MERILRGLGANGLGQTGKIPGEEQRWFAEEEKREEKMGSEAQRWEEKEERVRERMTKTEEEEKDG